MTTVLSPDVVVLGGGSAGVAAAVGAAREHATVWLVERYGFLGGMATSALVGTVCGLHHRSTTEVGRWAVGGFPRAFGERLAEASGTEVVVYKHGLQFLPYDPLAFRRLCDQVLEEAGVTVALHAMLRDVRLRDGVITEVDILAWDRPLTLRPRAVVDCTGTAAATTLAGLPVRDPEPNQAPAMGFSMTGLAPLEPFALRMTLLKAVTQAVRDGRLPADAAGLSVVPGTHRGDRCALKLGLPLRLPDEPLAPAAVERRARELVDVLVRWLREDVPVFSRARVCDVAAQVGIRTGRRPEGVATLLGEQVLGCHRPDDGVAVGVWPVEEWGSDSRPRLDLLPEGEHYLVPAGALRSGHAHNLWFAGRHLSADATAIASARVIGTCLGTGYAAGELAAAHALGKDADATMAALRDSQGIA